MLVLNKVKELRSIGLTYEFEGVNLQGSGKLTDNVESLVGAECFFKKLSCITDTAFGNVLLGKTDFVEFVKDAFF